MQNNRAQFIGSPICLKIVLPIIVERPDLSLQRDAFGHVHQRELRYNHARQLRKIFAREERKRRFWDVIPTKEIKEKK